MSSDKTEQPTPKKLRDARKKGQVAKSKEVVSAAVITGIFLYIWIGWDYILKNLMDMILMPPPLYGLAFVDAFEILIREIIKKMIILILPIVLIAMFCAMLANFFQIGFLFAFESAKPDIKKINPMEGIKKIFSMNNLVELVKSIIKIAFLGILIFKVIQSSIDPLIQLQYLRIESVFSLLSIMMKQVVIYTMSAFVIVAAADYLWQRHSHIKKLMMTKDEVKREFKEMEGDPVIKGKRKQLHKEMAMNDTVQRARKSTVVITNPTSLAVALYYDEDGKKLPVVLSKGQDYLAKRIVEAAREEGIPIMRNVPLARSLYEQVEMDHYIPSDLIEPVAEVLRWVQQLKDRQI